MRGLILFLCGMLAGRAARLLRQKYSLEVEREALVIAFGLAVMLGLLLVSDP